MRLLHKSLELPPRVGLEKTKFPDPLRDLSVVCFCKLEHSVSLLDFQNMSGTQSSVKDRFRRSDMGATGTALVGGALTEI